MNLQWCRVTESLAEFAFHLVLRREVDLLEEFRRDGDAASSLDASESLVCLHVSVEVVVCRHDGHCQYKSSQSTTKTNRCSLC